MTGTVTRLVLILSVSSSCCSSTSDVSGEGSGLGSTAVGGVGSTFGCGLTVAFLVAERTGLRCVCGAAEIVAVKRIEQLRQRRRSKSSPVKYLKYQVIRCWRACQTITDSLRPS